MDKRHYENLQETVYSKKLDNGLTVFLLPKLEMSKTYGIFSTNYGSIDQTFIPLDKQEQITVPEGIAHFLEHKLFEKEDRDVFADFSRQGASANAFTSFTQTAYLFASTEHVKKNILTLIDFVQDPYFSDESVEKEKGIIGQEINMYDDQPDWQSFMGTLRGLFRNHPVNIDIAGTVESIQAITKEDLYTCYYTFYHPENMVLFLTGNFEAKEIMDLVEDNQNNKTFKKMTDIYREIPNEPREAALKENKIIMPVTVPKCTIGIKESTSHLKGKDFLKRELLQEMILSYYFSKGGEFYQTLYEEDLIDASFFYETNLDRSFGYSIIGGNTNQPDILSQRIKELLFSTGESRIPAIDIERMKKKKIGQIFQGMNSLEFIASRYIHYHTFGIDFFELPAMIQNLTSEDVDKFLKGWIEEDRLTVCKIEAK